MATRTRRWAGLYVYRLEALTPDAPDMRRRYAVFDTRYRAHTRPEVVSQLGADALSCQCQEHQLGGGQDCPHVSAVRSAIARNGPPSTIAHTPPADEGPDG